MCHLLFRIFVVGSESAEPQKTQTKSPKRESGGIWKVWKRRKLLAGEFLLFVIGPFNEREIGFFFSLTCFQGCQIIFRSLIGSHQIFLSPIFLAKKHLLKSYYLAGLLKQYHVTWCWKRGQCREPLSRQPKFESRKWCK